jgi:hypothetical protein
MYQDLLFLPLRNRRKSPVDAPEAKVTATWLVLGIMTGQGVPVLTHTGEEMEGEVAEEKKMFL